MTNSISKNEIVLYQAKDLKRSLKVKVENDTIWLTQAQIVTLFDSSKANISEHIKHIFATNELYEEATVRKFRTVRKEGNRDVSRELTYYNLDMIISIGYRVNSIRGTQFRIWANKVLKDHLLNGYSLNKRMNRIEDNVEALNKKISEIDLQINTVLPPVQGIFFEGQIFDAYRFVSDLIRNATRSIILIDNYVDDSVLTILDKRRAGVIAEIFTKNINKQLKLDIAKHNKQYPQITVKKYNVSHDRFLLIDYSKTYHIGASLKDLGKKWFAFTKIDDFTDAILEKLSDTINDK